MKTSDVILHLRLPSGFAPKMESTPKPQTKLLDPLAGLPSTAAAQLTTKQKSKLIREVFAESTGLLKPAFFSFEGGVSRGDATSFKSKKRRLAAASKKSFKPVGRSASLARALRLWKARQRKLATKTRAKRKKSKVVLAKTGLRKTDATTVGVWDLGAWSGRLPSLLSSMNNVQKTYRFIMVEATVPLGIIRKKEAVIEWAERQTKRRLTPKERKEMGDNVVAHDFFSVAHAVRRDIGIDYLAGVTPSMVAFKEGKKVYWNFFSTFEGRCILASTYELREFAQESKRPFEVFLAEIILAQMLSAQYRGLEFHEEQKFCLFDLNQDRHSLVETARKIQIDPGCRRKIGLKSRDAAVALVGLLRRYK